jgi:hypothetical protein
LADFKRKHSKLGLRLESTRLGVRRTVKRIEVMDNPGENHFAEALAKALGPTAKGPSARAQIVALVSRLEPEAAVSGFSNSNPADTTNMLLLQMMSQNAFQMQQASVGGLGTQNSSSIFGTLPPHGNMAGPGNDPVQVYRTGRDLHWEFLRLWTGFELPSSWRRLPCYGADLNRNSFCVMRWPQIDLGSQDLNDFQRPKSFQKNSWK